MTDEIPEGVKLHRQAVAESLGTRDETERGLHRGYTLSLAKSYRAGGESEPLRQGTAQLIAEQFIHESEQRRCLARLDAVERALQYDERIWRAYQLLKPVHKTGLRDAIVASVNGTPYIEQLLAELGAARRVVDAARARFREWTRGTYKQLEQALAYYDNGQYERDAVANLRMQLDDSRANLAEVSLRADVALAREVLAHDDTDAMLRDRIDELRAALLDQSELLDSLQNDLPTHDITKQLSAARSIAAKETP